MRPHEVAESVDVNRTVLLQKRLRTGRSSVLLQELSGLARNQLNQTNLVHFMLNQLVMSTKLKLMPLPGEQALQAAIVDQSN
ncbi:Os06g0108150 [Oryza sativa Japonica Group]|uniref:Os06g0108150 protein n=1 Tax=Oryza sativa subsp. japonica TaxID=39947 RepID=A0A0P0WRG9_ORYSJ|nr:Os06g0108150 [Oryza sativa Japonica Group]